MKSTEPEPWNNRGEQMERNFGGYTLDNKNSNSDGTQMGYGGESSEKGDPIHGYVESSDPSDIQNAIKEVLDKEEREKLRRNKIIETARPDIENSLSKPDIPSLQEDSLDHVPEDKEPGEVHDKDVQEQEQEVEMNNEAEEQEQEVEMNNEAEGQEQEVEMDNEAEEQEQEVGLSEQDEKLQDVFNTAMGIRELYKNPGRPSYRLMSVGAVEMKPIEQKGDKKEIVKNNNNELERAVKNALGDKTLDEHAEEVLASMQLYISEGLIGDDADSVSIGTTETIVNQQGAIGKDSEKYKNLVVLRWMKNGINHVVAFSPRKDASIYALVDDSSLDSWRDTFVTAGAIAGEERKNITVAKHEAYEDKRTHEKTIEKCMLGILAKETRLLASDDIDPDKRATMMKAISDSYERMFAYYESKELGTTPPSAIGIDDDIKNTEDNLKNGNENPNDGGN